MVSLTWLNIDFVRMLDIVNEIGRVVIALGFRRPPPTYTFRSLEPVYKDCIDHYQSLCDQKYREITANRSPAEATNGIPSESNGGPEKEGEEDIELDVNHHSTVNEQKRYDELEILLQKHARLITNLHSLMEHPHLHPRKHSDEFSGVEDSDAYLGPERYIDPPTKGYGFSNDYIRQLLAAIPGRIGQHFEAEEAGSVHLTAIFQQIVLAILGGAALLTPMIIMTFVTGIHYRLIIVSVATVLFGTAYAIFSSSKESVLAGTAAYAAIMVVYIGSASPDTPASGNS